LPAHSSVERKPGWRRETYAAAARLAASLGLGVNAGHDLDLANLAVFRRLPFLDEVSIGHAIISRALFVGLDTVVREYLDVLAAA
jgi:pyridoxine 5-phosphate synthase